MRTDVRNFRDLRVYAQARRCGQEIYRITRSFPETELWGGLTSQILRSSRSVRANLAEAWRKRRYPASFVAKLNDAQSEASETQEWLVTAWDCGYITKEACDRLSEEYEHIMAQLVKMAANPEKWVVRK